MSTEPDLARHTHLPNPPYVPRTPKPEPRTRSAPLNAPAGVRERGGGATQPTVPPAGPSPGKEKSRKGVSLAARPGCPSSLAYLHGPLLSSSGNSDALASITTAPFRANRTTPPGFGAACQPGEEGRWLAGWRSRLICSAQPTPTRCQPTHLTPPNRDGTGASGRGEALARTSCPPRDATPPRWPPSPFCVAIKLSSPSGHATPGRAVATQPPSPSPAIAGRPADINCDQSPTRQQPQTELPALLRTHPPAAVRLAFRTRSTHVPSMAACPSVT